MGPSLTRTRVLLILLVLCVVSTTIHYTDNAVSIHKYPQGAGATATTVTAAWFLLTPAAIVGYRLYTSGKVWAAYLFLAVYSVLGASTPIHYTEATFGDFAVWRNVSILTDGVTGGAVLGFVVWSALVAREWDRGRAPADVAHA